MTIKHFADERHLVDDGDEIAVRRRSHDPSAHQIIATNSVSTVIVDVDAGELAAFARELLDLADDTIDPRTMWTAPGIQTPLHRAVDALRAAADELDELPSAVRYRPAVRRMQLHLTQPSTVEVSRPLESTVLRDEANHLEHLIELVLGDQSATAQTTDNPKGTE